jgi:hypothetical protein
MPASCYVIPIGTSSALGAYNYQVKLADWPWHVYRLIGKLGSRIYNLSAPSGRS